MLLLSSLRAKVLAGCSIAIIGSAIGAWFAFSRVAEKYALSAIQGRADALVKNTAFVAAPLIAFDSSAELKKSLDLLRADPDFVSARVLDADRHVLASSATSSAVLTQAAKVYAAKAAVMDNGKIWGYAELDLSLDRMQSSLESTRHASLLFVLLLAPTALGLVYWLVHVIVVAPVAKLRNATVVLGRGEFPDPVELRRSDEIGALSKQFNCMVEELKNAALVKNLIASLEEDPSGGSGLARQERISRQYEPRNSHAYERHCRDDGADSRYRPQHRAARICRVGEVFRRAAVDGH